MGEGETVTSKRTREDEGTEKDWEKLGPLPMREGETVIRAQMGEG